MKQRKRIEDEMEKTGVRERDKLENRANAAAGAWLSTPVIPALHKAKARGLQAGAQSGQFSDLSKTLPQN